MWNGDDYFSSSSDDSSDSESDTHIVRRHPKNIKYARIAANISAYVSDIKGL